MRRLVSILAAGVLAAGTVVTTVGASSAGATPVHRLNCSPGGSDFMNVTVRGVNYFVGTPNNTVSGATVRLKPSTNRTTLWAFCEFADNSWLVTNQGLAMTSRSTSPGENVTVETAGNSGNGFASQHWFINPAGSGAVLSNLKTGLFLRIRNTGPIMGQSLTTGSAPTVWIFS